MKNTDLTRSVSRVITHNVWVRGILGILSFLLFLFLTIWGMIKLIQGLVLVGIGSIIAMPIIWFLFGYFFPPPPPPRIQGCC